MKVFFKDLSRDEQKVVRSALNGNGLTARDVIIYKDGVRLAVEIKSTNRVVVIN